MIVKISSEIIPFGRQVQEFCKNKYPQHASGCPNYGKKKGCPLCELIDEILDFGKPIYLIYTEFNLGEFAARMREKHKNWGERMCYNLLYWQGKARKEHEKEIEKQKENFKFEEIVRLPESKGVNVNLLMNKIGVKLEWPAMKITRIISLAGWKNKDYA